MNFIKFGICGLLYALTNGCAHTIAIGPDVALIAEGSGMGQISANVGYYFQEDREKEVTSPGGGGDKVRYKPYKDLELGFYKALTNVFEGVHSLDAGQAIAIDRNSLDYVIALKISTNSSSSSILTWPPTDFGVNLSCDISDSSGIGITNILVVGEGHAEYSEFSSDFSLSAKRASLDALGKLQYAFLNSPELKGSNVGVPETADHQRPGTPRSNASKQSDSSLSLKEKLRVLKRLFDEGLISEEIYQERQKEIFATQ